MWMFVMGVCLQSNRDYYIYYSVYPDPADGPAAIRWTHYKAHFHSKGYVVHDSLSGHHHYI